MAKTGRRAFESKCMEGDPGALRTALISGAVLGVAAVAPAALGATFTVTNNGDGNATGTLRWAVNQANTSPGADVITFDPNLAGQTILLTQGQIDIRDSVTINGPSASNAIVDAQNVKGTNVSRIFYIYVPTVVPGISVAPQVSISHLTLENGYTDSIGGALYANGIALSLDHVTIESSHASAPGGEGGGVAMPSGGSFTMTSSTVSGNDTSGYGGGLYFAAASAISISNSQIEDNHAVYFGGGVSIYAATTSVLIEESLISGNDANRGGGVGFWYTNGASVAIDETTFAGNSAAAGGGVYAWRPTDPITFTNDTFYANSATDSGDAIGLSSAAAGSGMNFTTLAGNGGLHELAGAHAASGRANRRPKSQDIVHAAVFIGLTPATGNTPSPEPVFPFAISSSALGEDTYADIGGGPFTIDHSLVEDTDSATYTDGGSNDLNADAPDLGILQNNGGPLVGDTGSDVPAQTQLTMMPNVGSPLINTGNPAGAPPIDEREYLRTDGQPDRGAVEVNGVVPSPPASVPALGPFGKLALALTTTITGLFMAGRRRS